MLEAGSAGKVYLYMRMESLIPAAGSDMVHAKNHTLFRGHC